MYEGMRDKLQELADAQEAREKELKEYPLAAYSMRALKDEIKRRKGKRA